MIFTKIKLYAAGVAVIAAVGMGASIAYLHKANQAKAEKILLLGHEKRALVDQVEQVQARLKDQQEVHLTYQAKALEAQADISNLKKLLSESRKQKDTKTYEEVTNRSLSINLDCLSQLTQGSPDHPCGPIQAAPSSDAPSAVREGSEN